MDFCHKLSRSLTDIIQTLNLGSKILISLALVLGCGYLLATSSEWSGDHMEIGCILVLTYLPILRFLLSLYTKQLLAFFFRLLSLYGWIRITLYLIFLLTFSYVFVAVFLDKSALMCMSKAKELFLSRLESNIMIIEEDRPYFEKERLHPLFDGHHPPFTIKHLVRYPMEDAQMNCTVRIKGFYGGRPFTDQVEWRRNGVPLKAMTDRFSVVTEFRELPHNHPTVDKEMKRLRLTAYELQSTLSIYLLDKADFGSYTCHTLDEVDILIVEWETKTGKKHDMNDTHCKSKQNNAKNAKEKSTKKQPKCTCFPDRQYFFQDVHTQKEEFRLIRMEDKHDQIEAPVTSILFFSTNYLHLSAREDVHSEYTVNDASFGSLCSDETRFAASGCSALQRLLIYFMNDASFVWWFNILPLNAWDRPDIKGAHLTSGHCLCENSFGRHNMNYTRSYYNRTSGRYELFEITHPHTLLVRPPKQNSSDFLANIWKHGSMKLLSITDYLPETMYDLTIIKDLAIASGFILNMRDAVFICLGFGVFFVVLYIIDQFLKFVGQVSRKCFVEGSMGYLYTAVLKFRSLQDDHTKREETETNKFDIFMSYSDSQTDKRIVSECLLPLLEGRLHLSVFLRQRDLPSNELELKGVSQAIENSQGFIIVLSKDLLQDSFLERETEMIMDTCLDRVPKPGVLVIKLDDSKVPFHWRDVTVHDWTSGNLCMEDHQLRLVHWLDSPTRKAKRQWSAWDVFMVCVPFLLLTVFYLIRLLL